MADTSKKKAIFTNNAVEDLSDIWTYTLETWSEEQADRYYYLILEGCTYLPDNPFVGKRYEEIHAGLRGYKVKHHIIFYIPLLDGNIKIIRILHERMDIPNHLKR